MTLIVRPIGNSFVIDDGTDPLVDQCPCCGKTLTEAAAKAIVKKIEEGVLTMTDCRSLLRLINMTEFKL